MTMVNGNIASGWTCSDPVRQIETVRIALNCYGRGRTKQQRAGRTMQICGVSSPRFVVHSLGLAIQPQQGKDAMSPATAAAEFKPQSVSLDITQALIETADRTSSRKCMIACSLRNWAVKHQKHIWSIHVTAESVAFNLNGVGPTGSMRFRYSTPASAAAKLIEWDEGKEVEPFRVLLDARRATFAPVYAAGPRSQPYKPRAAKDGTVVREKPLRRCARRWHGLRVIGTDAAEIRKQLPIRKRGKE